MLTAKELLRVYKDICKTHKPAFFRDFPGGLVVADLPSSVGDAGLIPDHGSKIPHAAARRPACHNY